MSEDVQTEDIKFFIARVVLDSFLKPNCLSVIKSSASIKFVILVCTIFSNILLKNI